MLEVAGYLASAFTGIVLGLTGGGGSLLAIPILVYLFSISPLIATSYSLFIVGCSSSIGFIHYIKQRGINFQAALYFGIPSIATVFCIRRFVIPYLKNSTVQIAGLQVKEESLMMLIFSLLIFVSAISILRSARVKKGLYTQKQDFNALKLFLTGIATGAISGFLGAGGGFLIVPALVLLMQLPMKQAIGTSLFIIALNSATGFLTDLHYFNPEWLFLLKVTTLTISGVLAGNYLSKNLNSSQLKYAFALFSIALAIVIFLKEIFTTLIY